MSGVFELPPFVSRLSDVDFAVLAPVDVAGFEGDDADFEHAIWQRPNVVRVRAAMLVLKDISYESITGEASRRRSLSSVSELRRRGWMLAYG